MEKNNAVLIIAGPSAVGKTVAAKAIVANDPSFTFLRSGTTREKRGDAFDDEYLYYTESEFLAGVARGEFAEYMRYGGNLYGTPKSELYRAFSEGKTPLMVLDLNGVESLGKLTEFSACSVYVYSPIEVIEGRLCERYLKGGGDEKSQNLFTVRCAQNRRDYGVIDAYVPYIYRLVDNNSTIDSLAAEIKKAFLEFKGGTPKDTAATLAKAIELKKSVE